MEPAQLIIALTALAIGTFTDIKTREVPDWVNRGLISTGFALSIILSLVYSDWGYALNSIIGFAAFFVLAAAMYYSGQWGGGDAKMIMGLGAVIGLELEAFSFESPFLVVFLFNILIVGAVYGILWSIVLSIKHFKQLIREIKQLMRVRAITSARNFALAFSSIVMIAAFFIGDNSLRFLLFFLAVFVIFIFLIWLYIKAVENACMLKYITPDRLTEGDWIAKKIIVNGRVIVGSKNLGVEKKQIRQVMKLYRQGKIRKVLVKEGIPFVPSFLAAFIVSYFFGNLFLAFI